MRALTLVIGMGMVSALLAAPAAAEQLRLGLETSLEYDDNIFNTREGAESDKEDDVVFRVGPRIQLRRTQGDLTYTMDYVLRWESFIAESGLDSFDHSAFARASWRAGPRTTIFATERFRYTRSLNRSFFIEDPADPDEIVEPDVEIGRERITTNATTLGVEHQFTPRLEGQASFSYNLYRFSEENRNASDTYAGTGSLSYSLTERDRVGGGLGVTWQTYETVEGTDSETFFYRIFGTWSHIFDPTMSLSVQAGPTLIDSDPTGGAADAAFTSTFPFRNTSGGGLRLIDSSTCPMVDDGQPFLSGNCMLFGDEVTGNLATTIRSSQRIVQLVDDRSELGTNLTFFANVRFVKSWENWRLLLAYKRTDSSSSGIARSTVLDLAEVRLDWNPSRAWRFDLTGSWSRRESATEQAVTVVGLQPTTIELRNMAGMLLGSLDASQSVNLRLFETDNDLEVTSWRATFQARRRLRRDTDVFLRFTYLLQERSDIQENTDLENFRVMLGLRWWFDPIVL